MKMFLRRKNKKPIAEDLKEAIKYIEALEKRINVLEDALKEYKENSLNNFSKISVLRFNPFKEMGGDQSFSIVILNDKNNGFILTSLYSREDTRIFTKPINNGISEYQLLSEEEKALQKAIKSNE